MFYVVAFLDDSVEVVPNNWLSDCGTWCHWPPIRGQAMTDAICQKKVPDHRWKKAEIKKIMRKCETFKLANKKANDAVFTSDLATTTDANTDVDEHPIAKRVVRKPATYSPHTQAKIRKCATEKYVLKSPRPQEAEALAMENLPSVPLELSTSADTPGAYLEATHSPCSVLALPGTQSEEVEGAAEMIEQQCSPQPIPFKRSTVSATAAFAQSLITRISPRASNLMTEHHVVGATVTRTAETGFSHGAKQHCTPRSTRQPIQDLRSMVADASSAARCLIDRTSPRRSNLTTSDAGTVQQGQNVSGSFVTSEECRMILAKLNRIDSKIEMLSRSVAMLVNRGGTRGSSIDVPTMPEGMKLPADTVKDLKDAASFVKQNERAGRGLTRYLSTFGATTLTDTVNGMMKAIMTNELSRQFNWTGNRGKHSFQALGLSPSICDAVRINEPTRDTVNRLTEDRIKVWLRQARDRDGGRKRRFLTAAAKKSCEKRRFEELPTDQESDDNSVESDN